MTKLEEWLLSLEKKDVIEEICSRGCPWCPAVEYCGTSPLHCCKEVLGAWAEKEVGKRWI